MGTGSGAGSGGGSGSSSGGGSSRDGVGGTALLPWGRAHQSGRAQQSGHGARGSGGGSPERYSGERVSGERGDGERVFFGDQRRGGERKHERTGDEENARGPAPTQEASNRRFGWHGRSASELPGDAERRHGERHLEARRATPARRLVADDDRARIELGGDREQHDTARDLTLLELPGRSSAPQRASPFGSISASRMIPALSSFTSRPATKSSSYFAKTSTESARMRGCPAYAGRSACCRSP